MFKKILSAFIGSLAAIWISAALIFMMFVSMIAGLLGEDTQQDKVGEHSVLYLDLTGMFDERYQAVDVQELMMGNGEMPQHLDEVLEAIDVAADDRFIDGMFINCGGSSLGYAQRQELVEAIAKFKKNSGKWVYAYGDTYTQADYYVATAADKILLNPVGMVDVRGIASQIPFFKNALDKLGVQMQVVKVGEFKSAVEPYILTEPSEPSRRQTQVYIDAIWSNVAKTIATNRKVSVADVNKWADSLIMTESAHKLVDNKVVDQLNYRRQVDKMLCKLTKKKDVDDLCLVTPNAYLKTDPRVRVEKVRRKIYDKVENKGYFALLYATGDIVDQGDAGIVGPKMVEQILELAEDDDVKGLVLRVNSGGGSAFASEQIWEAFEHFKSTGKPFYVSMSDYAASGGYYISCGADSIFCDANTLTGSIGIFGMMPCIKDLLNDKLGVNVADISTNPNADFMTLTKPMTAEQQAAMQKYVDRGYRLFTRRVADGRKLPIDSVLHIAEGRVWDGATAHSLGLVDCLGGVDKAMAAMANKLKMSADNYVSYPEIKITPFEQLLFDNENSPVVKAATATAVPEWMRGIEGLDPVQCRRHIDMLRTLKGKSRVQARMEPIVLQ